MSKEMIVIALGAWTIVLTQLGLPYRPWGAILFALTGAAVAVVGFLLRGEALSRDPMGGGSAGRSDPARTPGTHDHTNGIGPLN